MNDDSDGPAIRVSIENGRPPSTAIVEAVAAVTNTEPTVGPPLYDRVDPDALDVMFAGHDGGRITFDYSGCQVTVIDDTVVTVHSK